LLDQLPVGLGKKAGEFYTPALITDTYQQRKKESRYSRRAEMDEIERNYLNLSVSLRQYDRRGRRN